ncbi:RNA 2',3'-cyclic phosphodiesterase [Alkalibacterium sp.]|nr:MAG: RNA 2',3'-cyclic phosphodiesterase [Alkalibacterium sp.]
MRVFIAVEVSEEIKAELSIVQQAVRADASAGKFTSTENFHLTIHFIGEVNQEECVRIKGAMDKSAMKPVPFQLILSELGSFKKKSREIIWVGVSGNLEALYQLNKEVLNNLGNDELIDTTNNYVPHLTLGRQIQLTTPFEVLKEKLVVPEAVIPVESISLMESKRVNGQLVYEPIYRVRLSE